MSSLVPDNWATDEGTRNVVMISPLLLDYEPFWGTEKTKTDLIDYQMTIKGVAPKKKRLDGTKINLFCKT